MTPKLTVDLGLRWEYYTPLVGIEDQGGLSNYDPSNNTVEVAGLRQHPAEHRRREHVDELRPPARGVVPLRREDRPAGRLRHHDHPLPRQPLRLQLPGQADGAVQRAERLRARPGAWRRVRGARPSSRSRRAASWTRASRSCGTRSSFYVPSDLKEAKLHSWNVAFQRQLPWNLVGEVAYVGNVGKGIVGPGLEHQRGHGRSAPTTRAGRSTSLRPHRERPLVASPATRPTTRCRPSSTGASRTASWSRPRTPSSRGGELRGRGRHRDAGRHRAEQGPAGFDRTHVVRVQPSSGTCRSSRRTTAPCTGSSAAGSSAGSSPRTPGPRSTSRRPPPRSAPRATPSARTSAASPRCFGDIGPGQKYFDTSVFSAPAQNTWGNLTRNGSISGPGFWNLDASLVKRLRFGQRVNVRAAGGRVQPDQHAALQQPERLLRRGDVRRDQQLVRPAARPLRRAGDLLGRSTIDPGACAPGSAAHPGGGRAAVPFSSSRGASSGRATRDPPTRRRWTRPGPVAADPSE